MKRLFHILFWVLFLSFISVGVSNGREILRNLGLIQDQILISGTGSMYPTFPKGDGKSPVVRAQETVAWPYMRRYPGGVSIFSHNFFGYELQRGDIVDFDNKKTAEITKEQYGQEAGFVKRVIGLPGDTLEIRDGFVYLNGAILKEPYTASPRSTYGGDTLADCHKLTIPSGRLFVMGDNRKGSLDSRFSLGLITFSDIKHVLPKTLQSIYEKNWRTTNNDEAYAHQPTLNVLDFVNILNQKRKESAVSELNYNSLLSLSAQKRAEVMLRTNDFSIEASKSGYTLEKSIAEVGYDNVVFAETFARGYYEASELLENLLQFPETKKFILNGQYQNIGLSAEVRDVDNCPAQVVVVHLGGYIPPNYKPEQIQSWQKLYDNLNEVIPSWERLKGNANVNQETLSKLLNSFYTRKRNAEEILNKLTHNLWLTKEEKQMLDDDQKLGIDEENLINQLKK